MEKKENVFSKLLNKIKAFSNKYLGPDIIEPANKLTPTEEKELRGVESVGKEVHEENVFTVGQVIISEAAAAKAAATKANNRKNSQIQRN